jgi:hypothetical protein
MIAVRVPFDDIYPKNRDVGRNGFLFLCLFRHVVTPL